jgi:hypothetical protein
MTDRFITLWYDPPEGWRFGFPKGWPSGVPRTDENLAKQLKADGYPEHAIPVALGHTRFGGEWLTYERWMEQVDEILEKRTGLLSQNELPDWLSRDAYESGMSAAQGVDLCLTQTNWDYDKVIDEL